MYCTGCGREIAENQTFCRYCGAKNEGAAERRGVPANQVSDLLPVNQVFNRNVLCQYLYNVRFLEMYKKNLESKKYNLEQNINALGVARAKKYYMDLETIGWGWVLVLFIVVVVVAGGAILHKLFDLEWSNVFKVIAAIVAIAVVLSILLLIPEISDKRSAERYIKQDNIRIANEQKQQQYLQSLMPNLEAEIKRVEKLREEAYAINIIPSKFRNVYAAYFIYDYVSTSAATLNDALLHCDLDKIQQQLDKIIEQQEDMILELAELNANNKQLVRQNEQILSHAIQTENNTALAAQYAKVVSSNTSITACIQMSEYLHK